MCDEQQPMAGIVSGAGAAAPGTQYREAGKRSSPDPMHISVGELLLSWRRFRDEKRFLEIEVSRLKLRVAELEHERAIVLS